MNAPLVRTRARLVAALVLTAGFLAACNDAASKARADSLAVELATASAQRDSLQVVMQSASAEKDRALNEVVEAYLRLQYSTLDHLSRADFRHEYTKGGIGATIDAAPEQAVRLAQSFGLTVN